MEAMIFHFKQVMECVRPRRESLTSGREPEGRVGYYMVSTEPRSQRAGASVPSFLTWPHWPLLCEGVLSPTDRHHASVDIDGRIDR